MGPAWERKAVPPKVQASSVKAEGGEGVMEWTGVCWNGFLYSGEELAPS